MEKEWTVGSEVKRRRRALDLTQEQVGEKLSVNKSLVGHWESGHTTIKLSHLKRLADVLGCAMRDLVSSEPVEPFDLIRRNAAAHGVMPVFDQSMSDIEFVTLATNLVFNCSAQQRKMLRALLSSADSADDGKTEETGSLI